MSYRYNNYSLVVDSSFDPFLSLQEKLIPFTMYKEAVDKRNTELRDYAKEMSDFAFLDSRLKDNPNSQAAQLYKGFKDRFNAYSADFSKNGLHPGNTGVWMDLFRNYDPIVGQLKRAEKMRETIFNKRLNEKDNTMIYANDNPDIDDFIGGNIPNLYGISGNALYTKGAALAKAISDREVHSGDAGSVLGNYYRNWKETKGIPNPDITEFINQPYVQEELKKVMQSEGLDNLTGEKRARAEQYLLSGFAAGITYEEQNKLHRDLGKMTAEEQARNDRAKEEWDLRKKKMEREEREENARFNATFVQEMNEDGTPKKDANGNPIYSLNPELKKYGYTYDPVTGRTRKETTAQTPEEKEVAKEATKEMSRQKAVADAKQGALQKVTSKALSNNNGFDVEYGGTEKVPADRVHYDYAGAIVNNNGEWQHGAIGDKYPGNHGPIGSWWAGNQSENWRGRYTAESDAGGYFNKTTRRVVSASEMAALMADSKFNTTLLDQFDAAKIINAGAIERKLHEHKSETARGTYTQTDAVNDLFKEGYTNPSDIQLIEVSDGNTKDYLIAVQK